MSSQEEYDEEIENSNDDIIIDQISNDENENEGIDIEDIEDGDPANVS